MPRPSQQAKILEAALHCFAKLGYDATGIKHIADAAGVSEGALYSHFPSKEAVAQTLYEQYMERYVHDLQFIATQELSVQERLQSMIHLSFTHYRDNPDAMQFILIERPPGFAQMPQDYPFPLKIIAGVIHEGQKEGSIRDGYPLLLASIFFGCVLRPIITARSTQQRAFDLLHDHQHEHIISWAARAAIKQPTGVQEG
jgi:AcrR family transcriptional regulator